MANKKPYALAFPLLPDALEHWLGDFEDWTTTQRTDYLEHCRRMEMFTEDIWLQRVGEPPLAVVFQEVLDPPILEAMVTSEHPFDVAMMEHLKVCTGVEFQADELPPPNQRVLHYETGSKAKRHAFVFPVAPGQEEALAQLGERLVGELESDYVASRKRHGIVREMIFLQQTPQGTLAIFFHEADDVEAAYQGLNESAEDFDRWLLEQWSSSLLPPLEKTGLPVNEHVASFEVDNER